MLGRLYGTKKEMDKARESFNKALELNPDSQEALFNMARLEQALGSIDKALEKYSQIREKNPGNLRIAMLIGTLLDMKGDHSGAKEVYEEVLSRNPNISVAANNLAYYYAEHDPTEKNLARATELITPLLRKYKDQVSVADTAAWVYYKKGELERARDVLLGVGDKLKDVPVSAYHLGMIYAKLEKKEEARKYLEMAVGSTLEFPEKEKAEKALSELK